MVAVGTAPLRIAAATARMAAATATVASAAGAPTMAATAAKTGERDYCVLGEWDDYDSIVKARPAMIRSLDGMRSMLEDLGGDLGVTDPVSGEATAEYDVRATKH